MCSEPRRSVEKIFYASLAAVHGQRCVADYLARHPLKNRVYLVAIGKAASAMSQGALAELGDRVSSCLIISKAGHIDDQLLADERCQCRIGGHPLPDRGSLEAGEALCQFLDDAPADGDFLFLLSGGASSLVEILPDGVSLDELRRVNRWLLGSGQDIATINRVRVAFSLIKGGGLQERLQGRHAIVLLISDVAGNDPAAIGSGLLCPGMPEKKIDGLPGWLEAPVRRSLVRPGKQVNVHHRVIATTDTALDAAAEYCRVLGLSVTIMDRCLAGDAEAAARKIISQLKKLPAGIYLWGGETTLSLPRLPGKGGRNQHLALAAAVELAGEAGIVLLAAGTDGTDGPTDVTGAVIDSGTIGRGQATGFDPARCLRQANAGTFLEASGDLLTTGPTGTNVRDLVIAIRLDGVESQSCKSRRNDYLQ